MLRTITEIAQAIAACCPITLTPEQFWILSLGFPFSVTALWATVVAIAVAAVHIRHRTKTCPQRKTQREMRAGTPATTEESQ